MRETLDAILFHDRLNSDIMILKTQSSILDRYISQNDTAPYHVRDTASFATCKELSIPQAGEQSAVTSHIAYLYSTTLERSEREGAYDQRRCASLSSEPESAGYHDCTAEIGL